MADESVSEFINITNSDAETAKFYLESCNGDVANAVESYFANHETHNSTTEPPAQSSQPHAAAPSTQQRTRIAGLGDVDDEDSEEDEGDGPEDNEYYAGGEKSGVAVRGGKKTDHIENLFDSAREHGAVQGTEEDLREPNVSRVFTGQARTLAGETMQHAPAPARPQPVTIAFYPNGVFTIDDGEPRSVDDPQNAQFLDCIRQGMCPPELIDRNGGRPIKVNLVKKGADYEAPVKPRYVAFSGTGQTLADAGGSSSTRVVPESDEGGDWEGTDESRPATSIQLVSPSGVRVVTRFNLTHTVRDIRRYIAARHPEWGFNGEMRTGHPAKPLDDDSMTIEAAALSNSVVMLR